MSYGGYDFQQRRPVWNNERELHNILDRYRDWYSQGLTDVQISALIRQHFIIPHNPQSQFRRGKR